MKVGRNLMKVMVAILAIVALMGSLEVSWAQGKEWVDTSKYRKTPPWTVGYDIYFLGNTWSVQLAEEFKSVVARYPDLVKEVYYTDSGGVPSRQIANLEDLAAKKPDVIIVTPTSPSAIAPIVEKIQARGIPVIICGSKVDTEEYTTYVNADDTEFGIVGAEWFAEKLKGKGNIIALSGMAGISVAEDRWTGAMSVFEKYPGIKVVAHEYADWAYDKAKMVMESLLAAHPTIDGVWSGGGAMTMAAMEAFVAAGRPLVPMTGEDNNGFLKMWEKYQPEGFSSVGCSKPTFLSEEAFMLALKILRGEPVKKINILPVHTITDETLDLYVRPELPDSLWCNTHLPEKRIKELFKR